MPETPPRSSPKPDKFALKTRVRNGQAELIRVTDDARPSDTVVSLLPQELRRSTRSGPLLLDDDMGERLDLAFRITDMPAARARPPR